MTSNEPSCSTATTLSGFHDQVAVALSEICTLSMAHRVVDEHEDVVAAAFLDKKDPAAAAKDVWRARERAQEAARPRERG